MKPGLLGLALLLFTPSVLNAHAVVSPTTSRPGGYERYVLRVPNESDNPTVRIEITFPTEVRVISFSDVPGWQLEAHMDTTSGRALSAVWTGTLAPERFVELPFMAVNPDSAARIAWRVVQVYANGDRIAWAGAPGSNLPASVTVIEAPRAGLSMPAVLAGAALLLSAAALTIAVRRR